MVKINIIPKSFRNVKKKRDNVLLPDAPWRKPRRGGGSKPKPEQKVTVAGNTVTIDGVGFSVRPDLQETFIREKTGGRGSSAQTAIKQAQEAQQKILAEQRRQKNIMDIIAARKAAATKAAGVKVQQVPLAQPTTAKKPKLVIDRDTGEFRFDPTREAVQRPSGGGCAGRDLATCKVGERINREGTGSFTVAMDVGNNQMQDVTLNYAGGRITKVSRPTTGQDISERFRELQERERLAGTGALGKFGDDKKTIITGEVVKDTIPEGKAFTAKEVFGLPKSKAEEVFDLRTRAPKDRPSVFGAIRETGRIAVGGVTEDVVVGAVVGTQKGIEAARFAEETIVPAKTLDAPIYLPDEESRKEYNRLIEGSTAKLSNLKTGLTGGFIRPFLDDQQDELKGDIKTFEEQKSEVETLANSEEFKRLEKSVTNLPKELEKLSNKKAEDITQADVDKYDKLLKEYTEKRTSYDKFYDEYSVKAGKASELADYINKGMKGTGWQKLKVKAPKRAIALKGLITAYEVEKVVLATQVGGALLGKTFIGKDVTAILAKSRGIPIIGKEFTIGGVLSSKPIIAGTSGIVGVKTGLEEFKVSKDVEYSIAAGVGGTVGFLGSVYSKPIVETTSKSVVKVIDFLGGDPSLSPGKRTGLFRGTKAEMELFSRTRSQYGIEHTKKLYEQRAIIRASQLTKQQKINAMHDAYRRLPTDKSVASKAIRNKFFKEAEYIFGKNVVRAFKSTLRPIEVIIGEPPKQIPTPKQIQQQIEQQQTIFGQQSTYAGQGIYETVPAITPTLKISSASPELLKSLSLTSPLLLSKTSIQQQGLIAGIQTKEKLESKSISGLSSALSSGQASVQQSGQGMGQGLSKGTGQVTETITKPAIPEPQVPVTPTIPRRPRPPRPKPPKKPTVRIPGLPTFPGGGKKKVHQGYHAEYIPQGESEFKRLNEKQQTFGSALSTMARKVDKFRTTVGRIVEGKKIVTKTTKGKSPVVDTKDNYYKKNKHKFRTHSLSPTGNKGLLPKNTFVEKRKYRQDSPLERKPMKRKMFKL